MLPRRCLAPVALLALFACATALSSCTGSCARCDKFARAQAEWEHAPPLDAARVTTSTADIVVAHCKHNVLRWLPDVRAAVAAHGLKLQRVIVYSKCGRADELAHAPELRDAEVVRLPNVGRCDGTYAYHLARRYDSLADVVLFVKDSTWDYPLDELRALVRPVSSVLALAQRHGFGCFRAPDLGSSQWAVRRELFKFRLPSYVSAEQLALQRRNVSVGTVAQLAPFAAEMGMCEFAARALGSVSALLDRPFVPLCYGGSFVTTAERVRAHPRETYRRLDALLSRGDSIEEGHYAERLWAAILATPLAPSAQRALARIAGRNYAVVGGVLGISYTGVVKRCCCERPLNELERRPNPLARAGARAAVTPSLRQSSAQLRVVLVSHSFDLDGAPRYLLQLAKWFRARGDEVLCVAPASGSLGDALRQYGVRVAVLPELRQGPVQQWAYLHGELQQLPPFGSPDMIVLNTVVWTDLLYAHEPMRWCARAPRLVWVLHELELDAAHKSASGYWWGRDFATLGSMPLLRRTLLSADAVVFVARAQRAIWQQHDHGHFHVIPGHVEHALGASAHDEQPTRASLGIAPTAFLLSTVGTLCVRKRQALALDALERLVRTGVDAHLLLVGAPSEHGGRGGEADYLAALQQRASSEPLRGHVSLLPFDRSGWRFSAIADLHISASTHEAYPLNTLEAMRRGVPVIATAAGGNAEQFEADEVAWMTTPVDAPDRFIAAVERAHELHARGELARLGRIQQAFAAGAAGRFSDGWAELVRRLSRERAANDACALWNPEEACEAHFRRAARVERGRRGPAVRVYAPLAGKMVVGYDEKGKAIRITVHGMHAEGIAVDLEWRMLNVTGKAWDQPLGINKLFKLPTRVLRPDAIKAVYEPALHNLVITIPDDALESKTLSKRVRYKIPLAVG